MNPTSAIHPGSAFAFGSARAPHRERAFGVRSRNDITRALREGKIRFKRAIERVTFRGHAVHPETFRRRPSDRNRFRLRVPADLAPEDLDWENSRPRRPWPLGQGYFAHIARLELSRRDLERVFSLVEAKASNEAREEADAERKRAEAKRKRRVSEAKRKRKLAAERAAREEASQADAERKRAEAKRKRRVSEAKRKRKLAAERAAHGALEKASHASDSGRAQPRRYWALKAIDGAYPGGVPTKEAVPNKELVADVIDFARDKGLKRRPYRHHPPRGGPAQIAQQQHRQHCCCCACCCATWPRIIEDNCATQHDEVAHASSQS